MALPTGWSDFDKDEQRAIASALLSSMRGRLILGQALACAVSVMEQAERPERSNIEDMHILATLCEPWFTAYLKGSLARDFSMLPPASVLPPPAAV